MNSIEEVVVEELLSENLSTIEYYYEVHEDLSEERDQLHQDIIYLILSREVYSQNKQVFSLGGAPANGKSTFCQSGLVDLPENALRIYPDEIKTMLPEYNYMIGIGHPEAALRVHEESSFLAKEIRNIALSKGFDLICDGVSNESLEKRLEDIQELKAHGHTVRIDYVTLDTSLSLKLARERFARTGRMVPENYIIDKNKMIAELVPQLIEKECFDELYLWDTNIENKPRLILSQKNGKLVIENVRLYEDFKMKSV